MDSREVVKIQGRIVQENRGQDALNGKTAAHGAVVISSRLERDQQIDDVITDVQKILRKAREGFCKFLELLAFKGLTVRSQVTL